jgi:hypothetical protein
MLWQKVQFKDKQGKVLFGCYEGIYFCGEICQEKFKLAKIEVSGKIPHFPLSP